MISTPSSKVKTRDKIEVHFIEEKNPNLIPEKIHLDIVYEDKKSWLLIKGMVVHPGAGNYSFGKCFIIQI